jgi:lycopene elongase/hydratase (dihydrobisanhydrobacterioruberin-forming)
MAAHTMVGYLLAVGVRGALSGEGSGAALLGLALWVVCLNGGTLAINSAYDRDEQDIAYLRQPPPPPRHLAGFASALMVAGLVGSLVLPLGFRVAYLICLVLSLLYSVPPFRLKAVPGADWIINMWGFGTLTPYAGWAATGLPLRSAPALILLGFAPLFAALYPLTQIYQFEEDARRGDRTLARTLGIKRSLLVAMAGVALGFTLFGGAGLLAGWGRSDSWRWAALAISAAAWALLLVRWLARHAVMTTGDHQRGMYLALGIWALTDVVVVLSWAV